MKVGPKTKIWGNSAVSKPLLDLRKYLFPESTFFFFWWSFVFLFLLFVMAGSRSASEQAPRGHFFFVSARVCGVSWD